MIIPVSWQLLALPVTVAVLVGLLAGAVGAIALIERRIFLAESLTHSTFPGAVAGVVVAAWAVPAIWGGRAGYAVLSVAILVGAALMCLPMLALARWLQGVPGVSAQAAAGAVLSTGFALGYLLSTWFAPLPLKVDGFLAGSLLNVKTTDAWTAGVCLALTALLLVTAGPRLAFHAFDPVGHRASGMSARAADAAVMGMVCVAIVVLVPSLGTILPIALIAAPAAAVVPWVRSVHALVIGSALVGAGCALAGLAVAVLGELSAGGCIGALCALVWAGSVGTRRALSA
ncbi:metal ABC transporter permease [Actinomyces respiraculi]|uniref:metal ABC transporter permease n=1 Tax=Actinomyces respiraculi TaxID=2744574 RepID=UPI001F275032|nr:metal ABC transporter permease [Actinomyces respiraculi]